MQKTPWGELEEKRLVELVLEKPKKGTTSSKMALILFQENLTSAEKPRTSKAIDQKIRKLRDIGKLPPSRNPRGPEQEENTVAEEPSTSSSKDPLMVPYIARENLYITLTTKTAISVPVGELAKAQSTTRVCEDNYKITHKLHELQELLAQAGYSDISIMRDTPKFDYTGNN